MATHSIPPDRKNVPVHLTPGFRDDLAILMANGATPSTVIRDAVHTARTVRQGDALVLPLDGDTRNDLITMYDAGLTHTDAIRAALSIVAGTYRNAWATGVIPEGDRPEITDCSVRPYAPPAPVGGSGA